MEATQDRINGLIEGMKERAADHGLSVRCPVCNAGIGKWCRVDTTDPTSAIVKHKPRVAEARHVAYHGGGRCDFFDCPMGR